MKYLVSFMLLLTLSTSCSPLRRLFHGPNYTDKEGMRQGRWRYTAVTQPEKIESIGRFKDDRPAGKWKYYDSEENLLRKEKYKQKKGETCIKTTFYLPNGQIEKEGWAVVEYSQTQTHYYWIGTWNYYNAAGELVAIKKYTKGLEEPEIIWEE